MSYAPPVSCTFCTKVTLFSKYCTSCWNMLSYFEISLPRHVSAPLVLAPVIFSALNVAAIGPPVTLGEYTCHPSAMVMWNSSSASVSFSIFISADVFTGSTICAAAVIASISNHITTVPVFNLCFIIVFEFRPS